MPLPEEDELALYDAFQTDPDPRLFVAPAEHSQGVGFPFGGGWRECRIWEGYLDASGILLREALQRESWANSLIFPAMFNLRHAIEVALKWHIRYAGGVVPPRTGHDLEVLIAILRETAADLDDEASYISEGMLTWIAELASLDPRALTFRYPTTLDGAPIEIRPERWDLRRVSFAVDTLSLYFDGLSGLIDLSRGEEYQASLR